MNILLITLVTIQTIWIIYRYLKQKRLNEIEKAIKKGIYQERCIDWGKHRQNAIERREWEERYYSLIESLGTLTESKEN